MLLKLGSKGENVKKVQEKLGIDPDGDFGPNTEKILKQWQVKNGLDDDGIVGDNTWSKMFSSIAKPVAKPTIQTDTVKNIPFTAQLSSTNQSIPIDQTKKSPALQNTATELNQKAAAKVFVANKATKTPILACKLLTIY